MAVTASVIEAKTYEDLRAIPEDLNRYELIFGEIVVSPAPKSRHQTSLFELATLMKSFVGANRLGRVLIAPLDVKFSIHNVVEPDLFFIRRDRMSIFGQDFVSGPPDLIVEVLSPSNRIVDLLRKAVLYADNGVQEYWIVDPEADTITVNVLQDGNYLPQINTGGIARSQVIAGFEVRPEDIFNDPDWLSEPSTETE